MHRVQGFTLIEVMVTVLIVAIIAAIGAPSLKSFMDSNKVRAEAQRLVGILSLARNHAVTNNQAVIVYGSVSNGALSLDLYTDDGDATVTYEAADDDYIQRSPGQESNLDFGSNVVVSADNAVRFDANGRLNETGEAIITICDEDNTMGRQVSVNIIGRATVSDITTPSTGCL